MASSNHPVRIEETIFLLGMPRSGTTWLSQIFEASPEVVVRLSPNYSYPLKNSLTLEGGREAWLHQLSAALDTDDPFMTQDFRRDTGELTRFEKDPSAVRRLAVKDTRFHGLYQRGMQLLPAAKCLYIVRNPCGALNSWRKSPEFPDHLDFLDEWRSGACRKQEGEGEYWGFDDWVAVTRAYLDLERAEPERFLVFRYEDLVAHPSDTVRELFAFVGVPPSESVSAFLERSQESHDDRTYAVFKTPDVAGQWKSELDEEIRNTVESELSGTELSRFL